MAYGLRARGERGAVLERRVIKALERVDLGPFRARKPAALSGGQRQRVALARALAIEPQVLLMDEPLSNLDARLRLQVRETIMELQREARITTVFVTHDQEESLSMSDRIGVMNQGRIEQIGSPKEIYATPATIFVADFVGAANRIPVTLGRDADATRPTVRFGDVVLQARCAGPVPNGEGVLVLRPEDLGMDDSPATDGAASSLAGNVVLRQYLGSRTAYKVLLGGAARRGHG